MDNLIGSPTTTNTTPDQLDNSRLLRVAGRELPEVIEASNKGLCLHHLFEMQVARTPEEVAVISASVTLTYFELNRRSGRLARYLRRLGVGPEVLVGIMTERSVDMLVGILAILKAGGAYLPLDHRYPHERLSLMVSDAQISLLLTQSSLAHLLRDIEIRTVCVDADSATISQEEEISSCAATESNLAYVIYTSGSTGRPKGVMIEHRSAVALVQWARTAFSAAELNGVLASTSICFDLSVFELFVPLAWGGRVIIVDDVLQLSNFHAAEEVTLINTVPSGIRGLLRLSGIPRSVRTVNLAGEPLGLSLVQELYQYRQIARVLNLYGPSEDTTYSTFASIARESDRSPSIGVPISNTQVHILNADMETVPSGEVGELYLSGAGLARGYLGWPGLTAERFVSSPFSNEPGARLYKTGDLGRYLPDSEIEFLGRLDQQGKRSDRGGEQEDLGVDVLWLYQASGLQWLVRKSHLLHLFSKRLPDLELLLPNLPPPHVRQHLREQTPAEGVERQRVGFLAGCVMRSVFAQVNAATLRVLARNGCRIITPRGVGCCGALHAHHGDLAEARQIARQTISAFEAYDLEAVIVNSAGCGAMLKEYGQLLADDPVFAARASAFSRKVRDVSEFLANLPLNRQLATLPLRVAYDDPCHLLHGQRIGREPRQLLQQIPGLELVSFPEADWCCGSAGIYNLTQPEMSRQLLDRKMRHIAAVDPDVIASGNPGCLLQLGWGVKRAGLRADVVHPVELVDRAYRQMHG